MTTTKDRCVRYVDWLRARDFADRELVAEAIGGISRVVVIPVLAESERLVRTLASLAENPESELAETLVICVVNNRRAPYARDDQIADNRRSLELLAPTIGQKSPESNIGLRLGAMRLAYVDASSAGRELAPKMGVGEARRIGLDHGLAVLSKNDRPDGLLISLDADTTVAPDYLRRIREHFDCTESGAAVVAYAHPLPDDSRHREAIILYELFLRYHELGLRAAGSPYAVPTIGSTIVVRGSAYVAAGGMNRRQAGEDFYFLQQLIKTGSVSRIDTTTVHPSARASDRVPFGTGASIDRHCAGDDSLRSVYNPESYRVLGEWLSLVNRSLRRSAEHLIAGAGAIEGQLESFLMHQGLILIHFLRDHGFESTPIREAVMSRPIVRSVGVSIADPPERVLERLRAACRELPCRPATIRCRQMENAPPAEHNGRDF